MNAKQFTGSQLLMGWDAKGHCPCSLLLAPRSWGRISLQIIRRRLPARMKLGKLVQILANEA